MEWVDADGAVLGIVSRRRMRDQNLRHRCTYVAVVTGGDELVVHQRADWKDVSPGAWDLCFGGVAAVGEGWEPSARRELAEEAGLTGVELEDLGPVRYEADDGRIVGRVYLARSDAEPTCPDGEVQALERVPLRDLDRWLDGRTVSPDTATVVLPVLRRFLTIGEHHR